VRLEKTSFTKTLSSLSSKLKPPIRELAEYMKPERKHFLAGVSSRVIVAPLL